MEFRNFERLVVDAGGSGSRRRILQGVAALIAGVAGVNVLLDDVDGKSRSRNRRRAHKRKKNAKKQCNYKGRTCAAPINQCQSVSCKNKKCVTENVANGTACGQNAVCNAGQCGETCDAAETACSANTTCCSGSCTCGGNVDAGVCQGAFSQSFNQNAQGWEGVSRVPGGTNGIPAHSGSTYAQAQSNGTALSRLGGYSNVFPEGGYKVELWIYLDPATATAGQVFDYTTALNQPNCTHRRDFNFRVGKGATDFCIGASNNAGGAACEAGGNPVTITTAGWYLFRHTFTGAVGSAVSVKMQAFTAANVEVYSRTLSDPSDIIGATVGGNRYAWFPAISGPQVPFGTIAIDDSSRSSL